MHCYSVMHRKSTIGKHLMQQDNNTLDAIIIGTGFGGIGMAIQLKKAGFHSFVILEKADQVGGTWRDNTYPGAACDVQSHLYSFSFEPKSDWSRKFGKQAEIHAYIKKCTEKYDLTNHLRFNQQVTDAQFDETSGVWTVTSANGDHFQARSVIAATGQLNAPAIPAIQGLDSFEGKLFHSARWDHDYPLDGKRVAVIGTGASAIQFVPKIVDKVKSLALFQRSGAWVIDKPDRPFRAIEQEFFRRVHLGDRLYRDLIYAKNEVRALAFTRFDWLLNAFSMRSQWLMRKHIADTDKRRRLKPNYKIGCKRILLSNDWYPAIAKPNLDLITDGIERVEKNSVITRNGERHEVDAIILATGFKATDFLTHMQVTGRNKLDLNKTWEGGAEAYKGTSIAGFPNFFLLYGPNTNLAHNSILFMLESQYRYVLAHMKKLKKDKLRFLDVKPDRQAAFNRKMQQQLKSSVWTKCHSWYTNDSGKITNNWPGFTFEFRWLTGKLKPSDYEKASL